MLASYFFLVFPCREFWLWQKEAPLEGGALGLLLLCCLGCCVRHVNVSLCHWREAVWVQPK